MSKDMRLANGGHSGASDAPGDQAAELEAARLRIKELEAQNAALTENAGSSQGNFPAELKTTGPTKKKWPFVVSVLGKTPYAPKEIDAVDETEAIRIFVHPASNGGKAIDTVKFTVKAECKTPRERRDYGLEVRDERNLRLGHPVPLRPGKQQPLLMQ